MLIADATAACCSSESCITCRLVEISSGPGRGNLVCHSGRFLLRWTGCAEAMPELAAIWLTFGDLPQLQLECLNHVHLLLVVKLQLKQLLLVLCSSKAAGRWGQLVTV